jgi:hypothetical protein
VQTDSVESNKKPDKNADNSGSGQQPQKKHKKHNKGAAEPGNSNETGAQADFQSGNPAQPVAETGNNGQSNQRINRGFGATQNVTNAPDSNQPPIVNNGPSFTSSGQAAEGPDHHKKP